MIKDSGERRQFYDADGNPLAVRDMAEGKGRFDLMPWAALMEVAKHCENGAKKYGEHNVDKGLPTSSFMDSAIRHLAKHIDGWTDEPHLISAAWNVLWAIQMEIKHPELNNVPWQKEPPAFEVKEPESDGTIRVCINETMQRRKSWKERMKRW